MEQPLPKLEQDFLQFVRKTLHLNEALNLMLWDMKTGAPKRGLELRAEAFGTLSAEAHAMSTSVQMKSYIDRLSEQAAFENLSNITKKTLDEVKWKYEQNKKIPVHEYKEYMVLQANAGSIWETARERSDFAMFRPCLEKLVEFNRRFADYWGYDGNRYDAHLDLHEPGMTVETLDGVFAKVKEHIVTLVKRVTEANDQPRTSFLFHYFPKDKQRELSLYLLKTMGYDFDSGRLDETVHPFAISINHNDVRVTTAYYEHDFRKSVFSTIHEGGHALYEQNIAKELIGTPLCAVASGGIDESQSLFWEKLIGQHKGFWKCHYPALKEWNRDQFEGVELEDFYRAIHFVEPSSIRLRSDELTYQLHIIIRYEIEKALFNNEIEVKDLPGIWNEKMSAYLGITSPNDAQGVLQDMHWSLGLFGYFPSYALGYVYAAQFRNTLMQDLPDFNAFVESGNLAPIKAWLTDKIHRYGKRKKPNEFLQDVTGEGLNPDYLLRYFEQKYTEIYRL